jgi:hypothetical protein
MRRRQQPMAWPARLEVCDPTEWVLPGEDAADPLTVMYSCWIRWCDARADHLGARGVDPEIAQVESVGRIPRARADVAE